MAENLSMALAELLRKADAEPDVDTLCGGVRVIGNILSSKTWQYLCRARHIDREHRAGRRGDGAVVAVAVPGTGDHGVGSVGSSGLRGRGDVAVRVEVLRVVVRAGLQSRRAMLAAGSGDLELAPERVDVRVGVALEDVGDDVRRLPGRDLIDGRRLVRVVLVESLHRLGRAAVGRGWRHPARRRFRRRWSCGFAVRQFQGLIPFQRQCARHFRRAAPPAVAG